MHENGAINIISYNVNGIRAAVKKGFLEWLAEENADVVCLQETKAQDAQLPIMEINALGYEVYHCQAVKKGYSGVAVLTKIKPDQVIHGIGIDKYDHEGRYLRLDFGELTLVNAYHPSGSSGDERQAFKMKWLDDFQKHVDELKQSRPKLVLCGDYNICHRPIDIHDPVRNAKSSGFLPEEREWIDGFINSGFIDSFRHFNKDPHNYSWWSYRANARANNKGWRIDYIMASENLESRLKSAGILPDVKHSDHCPIHLKIELNSN